MDWFHPTTYDHHQPAHSSHAYFCLGCQSVYRSENTRFLLCLILPLFFLTTPPPLFFIRPSPFDKHRLRFPIPQLPLVTSRASQSHRFTHAHKASHSPTHTLTNNNNNKNNSASFSLTRTPHQQQLFRNSRLIHLQVEPQQQQQQ